LRRLKSCIRVEGKADEWEIKMIEPMLGELAESLRVHDRTVKIGFMLYELLNKAGYDDAELADVAKVMKDIVS
jgi:hypothetical protein